MLQNVKIGFCVTGSFCTFSRILPAMEALVAAGAQVQPIFSPVTAAEDTRFFQAADFRQNAEAVAGRPAWDRLTQVEPIGPKALLDLVLVAPCTGNTLGKLANGIIDTPVTMAVKSHLRNGRPVVLAVSTNDGLTGSAANLGVLLNRKNYYFVPFGQDNYETKPASLVAHMEQIVVTCEEAMQGRQIQPLLMPS